MYYFKNNHTRENGSLKFSSRMHSLTETIPEDPKLRNAVHISVEGSCAPNENEKYGILNLLHLRHSKVITPQCGENVFLGKSYSYLILVKRSYLFT